jgi:hypothetical protein
MGSRIYNQNIEAFKTYFNLHMWLIAKTWLNFFMDDLEKKILILKSYMSLLLLLPFIIHSFFE